MKKLYCKTRISNIVLTLILTFTVFLTSLQCVNCAEYETAAFMAINPNPVGVDQNLFIAIWMIPLPPAAPQGEFWEGLEVEVTKPDQTSETLGPFTSDFVGLAYTLYVPRQVGTYYFQMSFPEQTVETTGDTYKSSVSPEVELTVQEEPVPDWPEAELPEDYWERPIYGENRNWASVTGNWIHPNYNSSINSIRQSGGFNPYTTAPRSAHILWNKPIDDGGLIGGEYGSSSFYTGLVYEAKFTPPLIINGKVYYNEYTTEVGNYPPGFICMDLYTGEELWRVEDSKLSCAQIFNYESGNQMGGLAFLWDTTGDTWKMFDAFNGKWMMSFENAGGGKIVYSPTGEMLAYNFNVFTKRLTVWNSTKAFMAAGAFTWQSSAAQEQGLTMGQWRPTQGVYNWTDGIQLDVSIPDLEATSAVWLIWSDVIVADNSAFGGKYSDLHVGYNFDGEKMWSKNRSYFNTALLYAGIGEGVYVQWDQMDRVWHAFDVDTGEEAWTSDPLDFPWGSMAESPTFAYDKMYVGAMDGNFYAFDANTGKEVWRFHTGNAGRETPYGHWPFYWDTPLIGGGVVFAPALEHSPTMPLYRGFRTYALDAETGDEIWSIAGMFQTDAIADGYVVMANGYDNQIYCFGKGPSATTVSAPQTAVAKGSAVMITGSVTDQSPGKKGTAAISDEYMSEWMEYLYMQKPKPENAKGVTVKLTAVASNGDSEDIGTVTSDMYGNFGKSWTPPDEGDYQIIATFEGTESYGSSSASTYLTVGPAPSPEQPIEPEEPEPEPEAPWLTTELAIILAVVAVAIIAVAGYWALRKRK